MLLGILQKSCKTLATYLNISSGSRKWKLNPGKPPALGTLPPAEGNIHHIIILKEWQKFLSALHYKLNPWWSGQTRLVSLMKTSFVWLKYWRNKLPILSSPISLTLHFILFYFFLPVYSMYIIFCFRGIYLQKLINNKLLFIKKKQKYLMFNECLYIW